MSQKYYRVLIKRSIQLLTPITLLFLICSLIFLSKRWTQNCLLPHSPLPWHSDTFSPFHIKPDLNLNSYLGPDPCNPPIFFFVLLSLGLLFAISSLCQRSSVLSSLCNPFTFLRNFVYTTCMRFCFRSEGVHDALLLKCRSVTSQIYLKLLILSQNLYQIHVKLRIQEIWNLVLSYHSAFHKYICSNWLLPLPRNHYCWLFAWIKKCIFSRATF